MTDKDEIREEFTLYCVDNGIAFLGQYAEEIFPVWQAAKESSSKELELAIQQRDFFKDAKRQAEANESGARNSLKAAKQRIAELEEDIEGDDDRFLGYEAQVLALEKKLAEQQGALVVASNTFQGLIEDGYIEDPYSAECVRIAQRTIGSCSDGEELTKLLAAARKEGFEEGKKAGRDALQQIPDGWKLVPVNPTGQMCDSGAMEEGVLNSWGTAIRIYTAMIAAAPQPPTVTTNCEGEIK